MVAETALNLSLFRVVHALIPESHVTRLGGWWWCIAQACKYLIN